ncbi:hypothetical protein SAMN05660860_00779 [Geoalkalibacter ferrihydriticus]|uniref:Uncharacterized protein n=2 Tax=Geoalkalibacter ferrihydriticus TaxID=392333 RepID=A0A0C2HVP7_9BACT|nr:hypothetical protein [Geoalkalibacter ferrihydriticus]KIH76812.1 hypothetical protein GFER_06785 [Geoalkalibacter ferrihydriticus DSM 17813]SDL49636.1 hypothetical protein SAMN05660860_00779 [Geoalkalibacter ferrihydriticus]
MSDARDPEFAADNFNLHDLDDEIRVDALCRRFLRLFYEDLTQNQGLVAEQAAALTYGADYFLRDFVISERQENIFHIPAQRVRQFAGNWYIIKNLEPNMSELSVQLQGVAAFYHFCARAGRVSAELAREIARQCEDLPFYQERIESFWDISGDGYQRWDQACSFKD